MDCKNTHSTQSLVFLFNYNDILKFVILWRYNLMNWCLLSVTGILNQVKLIHVPSKYEYLCNDNQNCKVAHQEIKCKVGHQEIHGYTLRYLRYSCNQKLRKCIMSEVINLHNHKFRKQTEWNNIPGAHDFICLAYMYLRM